MPQLIVTIRDGSEVVLEGEAGHSVMEIVHPKFPDDLLALCGGSCSCATCHVYVDEEFLPKTGAVGEFEDGLLDMSECRQPNSRLSCQIQFSEALNGLKVTIAPDE